MDRPSGPDLASIDPPCKPVLDTFNPDTGYSLTVNISTGCPNITAGFAVYRSVGVGAFSYLSRVKVLDPNTTYYVVLKTIDVVGNESGLSEEASVTPLP